MSDEKHAEARQAVQHLQHRDPMFSVVHDPLTDRFFLQEREEQATTRGGQVTGKRFGPVTSSAPSFPWEQVVLPPRSVSRSKAAGHNKESSASGLVPPTVESPSPTSASSATLNAATVADPAVDGVATMFEAANEPNAGTSLPSPTRRARLGNSRPTRASKLPNDMTALLLTLPEHGDAAGATETATKWNGKPVSVRAIGLAAAGSGSNNERSNDSLDPRAVLPTAQSTERDYGQWLAHTYDLKQLARIRPSADGFRDRNVNIGCTFTPMDPWPSESEPEEVAEEEEEEVTSLSDENELPVFQRGDRVFFRLAGSLSELAGRVIDRIHRSVFYDVQGSDGRVFKSVYAGNMSLRPARERKPRRKPRYHFAKHDKVLWLQPKGEEEASFHDGSSDSEENEQGTYKARVLKVHSLDRFDLLLRTGRIAKRVPYDQLRPRGAF